MYLKSKLTIIYYNKQEFFMEMLGFHTIKQQFKPYAMQTLCKYCVSINNECNCLFE